MTRQTVLAVHPGAELFGSDRMFLESVTGLCEAGHDVVVALPRQGPLVAELTNTGARVVIVPMLVLRHALLRPAGWSLLARDGIRGWVAARRLLKRLKPATVHVNTITLPHWPLAARLHGARTVAHVHEAEGHQHRLLSLAIYAPLLATHTVVVNSNFAQQVLVRSFPTLDERARVIYNGVASPADPVPPRPEINGLLRICFVGRLSHRKAPDLVIQVARILAARGVPAHVTLVGSVVPGSEAYERELRAAAAALPEGASVEFAGFVSDVWPQLAACDVAVVPSRLDESFGNTAVEAVLAQRPVIASGLPGLKEAVGDYSSARLVEPDDAAAWADALQWVRTNWAELGEQVAGERERAVQRHAPSRYRAAISSAIVPD